MKAGKQVHTNKLIKDKDGYEFGRKFTIFINKALNLLFCIVYKRFDWESPAI